MKPSNEIKVRNKRYDYIAVGNYLITLASNGSGDNNKLDYFAVNGYAITLHSFLEYGMAHPEYGSIVAEMALYLYKIPTPLDRKVIAYVEDLSYEATLNVPERKLQKIFSKKYSDVVSGDCVKLINRNNDPSYIPDLWVQVDGEDIPVEIKKGNFDKKALQQLQRYMDFYGCCRGIAVGKELTVNIPDNIEFISISSFYTYKNAPKLDSGRKLSLSVLQKIVDYCLRGCDTSVICLLHHIYKRIPADEQSVEEALQLFFDGWSNLDPHSSTINRTIDSVLPQWAFIDMGEADILKNSVKVVESLSNWHEV